MQKKSSKILITGAAGFIGYALSKYFLEEGYMVSGIDNMNDYYDVSLKETRVEQLMRYEQFRFYRADLMDRSIIEEIVFRLEPEYIVHLAAQAGVRYSIENPQAYIDSNIIGFFNLLEICRKYGKIKHLLYASSSSVYGQNQKVPFSTEDKTDHPISLYAATKKSNEMMAYCYSHLYQIPSTGLRFFTVYGPWGRPDMAYFSFTKKIFMKQAIDIFNHGLMERDFTYIDDIVESIYKLVFLDPNNKEKTTGNYDRVNLHQIYNIGNSNPVPLMRFIEILEEIIGIKAEKNFLQMQAGDVTRTFADVKELEKKIGKISHTKLEDGIRKFVDWYRDYYKISR